MKKLIYIGNDFLLIWMDETRPIDACLSVRALVALLVDAGVAVTIVEGVEDVLHAQCHATGIVAVALPLTDVTVVLAPAGSDGLIEQIIPLDGDAQAIVKEALGIAQVDTERASRSGQVHLHGACIAHRAVELTVLAELPAGLGIGTHGLATCGRIEVAINAVKLGVEQIAA